MNIEPNILYILLIYHKYLSHIKVELYDNNNKFIKYIYSQN